MIPFPPQEFMDAVAGAPTTGDAHIAIGHILRDFVADQCQIKPNDNVLDIGCGCGRVAAHFVDDFSGQYHGLDIVGPMVDWCRDNISLRYPNFHFHHADLANTCYPGGAGDAATYMFPFPDSTFDVVFATSVFTHLLPASGRNYMREIARVMRPGGRALLSFYLLTDEWRQRVAEGDILVPNLAHEFDGCRVADSQSPEAVIGYEKSAALSMISGAGLKLKTILPGSLSIPQKDVVQDTLIVLRP